MAANIKDIETERLIREPVRRTGETRKNRLQAIAKDTAPRLTVIPCSTDIGDLLYDSDGLPE